MNTTTDDLPNIRFNEAGVGLALGDSGIPSHMQAGIARYLLQGVRPGAFLCAVFANDFVAAWRLADETNKGCMSAYANFLHTTMPDSPKGKFVWGSHEAINNWVTHCQNRIET